MAENGANAPEATPSTSADLDSPADITDLVPAAPAPPPGIPEAEAKKAEAAAEAIAGRILGAPDDRSAVREATRLGEGIESRTNDHFRLMRTSLGQVMDRMARGESQSIPGDLKKLREVMDEINPYPALEQLKRGQNAGFFSRLFRRIPGVGKVLADIAQRYESVQTQVDAIIQSLEAGGDKLLENSIELEERYKNLKAMQADLKLRAYQLQQILARLDGAKGELTDAHQQAMLEKATAKILRRLQNLRVTENAFAQFFITMNTTLDNHENLREAVRSMTGLTRPVLENGLALKIAQQEERQIAEALSASQDYLGSLMVSVAEESMDNAARTAEVTSQPLIKLRDLTRSYQVLVTRMDEAAQIEAQMSQQTRDNIVQLEIMTDELEKRAQSQERGREVGTSA